MGDLDDLAEALIETIALVEDSAVDGWSHRSPRAVRDDLNAHLRALRAGDRSLLSSLKLEFAPTGGLQDLAIDNGWGERFLALAARVDAALGSKG